jgi:hypothetical protein
MKLTNEQKEANKLARAEARKTAKALAKIEAERNQKPVKEIQISIEWKKSRMWGTNPHLTAWVRFEDETSTKFCCTASGCGYDKESQVISDLYNEFLKYTLYNLETAENLPYGIRAKEYKGFEGGIGVSCYYDISKTIGGKFEKVATGKTYDAYKYTQIN